MTNFTAHTIGEQPVEVELGGGQSIWVTPHQVSGMAEVGGRQFTPDLFMGSLRSFATQMSASLRDAAPDELTVEFGAKFSVRSGKAVALLVDGDGECDVRVTMKWGKTASGA